MGDAFVSRCHVSACKPHWFSQCEPACNMIGIKCEIKTLQELFRLEIVFSVRNWSQCYRKGIVQIFDIIAWLQIENDINILKEKVKLIWQCCLSISFSTQESTYSILYEYDSVENTAHFTQIIQTGGLEGHMSTQTSDYWCYLLSVPLPSV